MLLLAITLVALSSLPDAHAVALGVNRASISFEDVLRGGYAETYVTVTTDSVDPVTAEANLTGEAAEWINLSATEFEFSRDEPYLLKVAIMPPSDAQLQDYDINLTVLTGNLGRSGGGRIGTATRASFRIPIRLGMTGNEIISCSVGGLRVLDTETDQPLELQLSILNRGNVRINPKVNLVVLDQLQSKEITSASTEFGSRILPTVSSDTSRIMDVTLVPGQYWADVSVPECGFRQLFTFDVLEPGGIKDDGDFLRLQAPNWAQTGDIIPINAVFRNKGVRGVRAVFKGTIARADTGEIVKVISTDEYIVGPDATAEIETFFNPLVGGQYEVRGKIRYNDKLTLERSTLINVNGAPVEARMSSGRTVIVVFIVIIILLLLILIRKRKQRRKF
jgi:hypothetical protein